MIHKCTHGEAQPYYLTTLCVLKVTGRRHTGSSSDLPSFVLDYSPLIMWTLESQMARGEIKYSRCTGTEEVIGLAPQIAWGLQFEAAFLKISRFVVTSRAAESALSCSVYCSVGFTMP